MLKLPYAVLRYRRRVERSPCCWWPLFCVFSHRPPVAPPAPCINCLSASYTYTDTHLCRRGRKVLDWRWCRVYFHLIRFTRPVCHSTIGPCERVCAARPENKSTQHCPFLIENGFEWIWCGASSHRHRHKRHTQPKRGGRKTEKVSLTFVSEYLWGKVVDLGS